MAWELGHSRDAEGRHEQIASVRVKVRVRAQ